DSEAGHGPALSSVRQRGDLRCRGRSERIPGPATFLLRGMEGLKVYQSPGSLPIGQLIFFCNNFPFIYLPVNRELFSRPLTWFLRSGRVTAHPPRNCFACQRSSRRRQEHAFPKRATTQQCLYIYLSHRLIVFCAEGPGGPPRATQRWSAAERAHAS